jgi:hypothetical protein
MEQPWEIVLALLAWADIIKERRQCGLIGQLPGLTAQLLHGVPVTCPIER